MSTFSPRTFAALLCALALLAGSCGGGSDSATGVGTVDSEGDADSPTTSTEAEVIESPIADLLGIPLTDGDAAQEYFSNLARQAEVVVAECMLAQGFEYHVVDYSQLDAFDANIDFESREFAEQYGFGIASDPFAESFESFDGFENPNEEYLNNLTEGEREAYDLAFMGELPDADEDFQNFEPGGCQGEAFEEVFAFGRVFEEFGDEFEAIEEAYEADPRIVGASTGWSGCMSEAGYTYSDRDAAESDIRERHIMIGAFAEPAPIDGEDVQAFEVGPPTLDPAAQAQVDELAVEERAIAVASWDCSEPIREIEDEVRLEYEQRFVDENGAAIREALGE